MAERFISLGGLFAFVFVAWAISEDRRSANWRLVAFALALQFALGHYRV